MENLFLTRGELGVNFSPAFSLSERYSRIRSMTSDVRKETYC